MKRIKLYFSVNGGVVNDSLGKEGPLNIKVETLLFWTEPGSLVVTDRGLTKRLES